MGCCAAFLAADVGKNLVEAMGTHGMGVNTNFMLCCYAVLNIVIAFGWTLYAEGAKEGMAQLFEWSKLKNYVWPAAVFALSMAVNLLVSG
jgi:hypothetical protein